MLAQRAETGAPPRGASTGYPVRERRSGDNRRRRHPEDQVKRCFRPKSASGIVVEVAIYPENGVIYQRSNDPAYGRQQGVGTYSGVGVTEPGQNSTASAGTRRDPRVLYDKMQRSSLADGKTKTVIARCLYFPRYAKRKKSDEIELKYARHDVEVNLPLGKP